MTDERLKAHLRRVRQELAAGRLVPRRRFSQSFLLDAALLERIAAGAGELRGRRVLEVGAGPGGLTVALLAAGARVQAIEIDRTCARFLRETLGGCEGLEVVEEDARREGGRWLAQQVAASSRPPIVVGNLPYRIASPLLVDLVEAPVAPECIVATIQEEVAARLVAPPGAADRGLLTLLVGLQAEVRRLFRIPAGAFTPRPKVTSAVVKVVPLAERRERVARVPHVRAVLRAAFTGRRKMLRSALAPLLGREQLGSLDPGLLCRRPAELTGEEWLDLAARLAAFLPRAE